MANPILEKYKALVWPEVKKYLSDPTYPKSFEIPKKYKKELDFYWKTVNEYPLRQGKYLRPALLLLTCEAMGGKIGDALKSACAMQISEEWILVHDDIEDGSLERRGKPAIQRLFGAEQAINAGDALQTIMWKVVMDNYSILKPQIAKKLSEEFYKLILRTTIGQSVEIKWFQENKKLIIDNDWFFVCNSKSAYYTIAGPMRLGAIIAGANEKQLDKLAEFGVKLGICFQLVDDLLDITSDFSGLKKQKGNDIFEGKKTLILGHLLRTATKKDKKKIDSVLKKGRIEKSQSEVDWIIERMHTYGSITYAQNIAKKYKEAAERILEKELGFLAKEPAKTNLKELTKFVLERNH